MPYIDLTASGNEPVFINPHAITHISSGGSDITVYHKDGVLYRTKAESGDIDMDDVVAKMNAAGAPLVALSEGYSAAGEKFMRYVSPAAVTFITASTLNDQNNTRAAVIGIAGTTNRIEAAALPQAEIDALVAALAKEKTMLHLTPEEAHARVTYPDFMMIDSAMVTQVRVDPVQVNLTFNGIDWLDVQAPRCSGSKITNDLYKANPGMDLDQLCMLANTARDAQDRALRNALAARIAKANGTLIEVKGSEHAAFLHASDIGCVIPSKPNRNEKPILHIIPPQDGSNHRSGVILYFNTAAARIDAIKALNQSLAEAASPQAKFRKQL